MNHYWARGHWCSQSDDYSVVTYDPPVWFAPNAVGYNPGPSSCIWLVPGTEI